MPVPPLPNELVDHILSSKYLTRGDLYETALVCSAWLEPSRKSLYHGIIMSLNSAQSESDNPYPLEPMPLTYSLRSWQLLSTLVSNPDLASFAKSVYFYDLSTSQAEPSSVSTSSQALIRTLLQVLPFATSFEFFDNQWLTPANVGVFYPHFDRLESITLMACWWPGWFEPLCRLRKLKSLSIDGQPEHLPDPDATNPTASPVSNLENLSLSECTTDQFLVLFRGSRHSLRSLTIPLDILPRVYPADCPSLVQLSLIGSSRLSNSDQIVAKRLLNSLSSSKVSLLKLSSCALEYLLGTPEFSQHIPSTCNRINLDGKLPSCENVVALLKKSPSSHRISQLGLGAQYSRKKDEQVRMRVAALRAITEVAGVDIIWM